MTHKKYTDMNNYPTTTKKLTIHNPPNPKKETPNSKSVEDENAPPHIQIQLQTLLTKNKFPRTLEASIQDFYLTLLKAYLKSQVNY